jgi:hypothetical protein
MAFPIGETTGELPAATGGPVTTAPGGRTAGATPGYPGCGTCCARADTLPAAMTMRRVSPAGRRAPVANRPFLRGRLIEILLPSAVFGDLA